jgi:hypothetical protein
MIGDPAIPIPHTKTTVKKTICMLLALVLCIGLLAGCGGTN